VTLHCGRRGYNETLQCEVEVLKVPRQCPPVLLVQIRKHLRKGKTLGYGKGTGLGYELCYEQRRGIEQGEA
jgi:hypothetical protein